MKLSDEPAATAGADVWVVECEPAAADGGLAARGRLLEALRPALARHLLGAPGSREFECHLPHCRVRALRVSEAGDAAGGPLRLCYAARPRQHPGAAGPLPPPAPRGEDAAPGPAVPAPAVLAGVRPEPGVLRLPDPDTGQLGARLVGLDSIRDDVLLDLSCRFDGAARAWSARTGCALPGALTAHLHGSAALYAFCGAGGTGKSALARVVADAYCRARGVPGALVTVGTEARGSGLVGDFSARVRAAFASLEALPSDDGGLRCLVFEEADALAPRRDAAQQHQEDRAATCTLLQCLDGLRGRGRVAVFLTTNRAAALDPALRRRAAEYRFARPGIRARRALLARWLPGWGPFPLGWAALLATGMTPADAERALARVYRSALRAQTPLRRCAVLRRLALDRRTGEA